VIKNRERVDFPGLVGFATMKTFWCPYLGREVELSDERESHIAETHPELLPEHEDRIVETLGDPDQVRRSRRFANARLFSKWYDDLIGGKHLVVVVVSEAIAKSRDWIVTAYVTRRIAEGDVEWKRS
jgi:hypothetical protein